MSNPQAQAGVTAMQKADVKLGETGLQLRNIDELFRFSQAIAGSALAPKDFIGKPESVMVAIQMGMEVGLPPMAALQNIAVINGRPSIWGDAQLAIVRSARDNGEALLEAFEETETNDEIEPIFRELCFEDDPIKRKEMKIKIAVMQAKMNRKAEDFGVSCFVRRRGFSEAFSRFTIADSKTANLWGKAGPWTQYPFRMLKARARSFLLRDQFGDALKGMMAREEAGDIIDITATSQAAAPSEFKPKVMHVIAETGPSSKTDPRDERVIGPVEAAQNSETDSKPVEVVEVKPNPTVAAPGQSAQSAAAQSGSHTSAESAYAPSASVTSLPTASTVAAEQTVKTQQDGSPANSAEQTQRAEFVLSPAMTPADWLPMMDLSAPEETRKSLFVWMGHEEITEEELIKWCISRNIAKAGQTLKDLAISKIIGIIKARESAVRPEVLKARPSKA